VPSEVGDEIVTEKTFEKVNSKRQSHFTLISGDYIDT
jgi:hypothetical protein